MKYYSIWPEACINVYLPGIVFSSDQMAANELAIIPTGQKATVNILYHTAAFTSVSFAAFAEKTATIDIANLTAAVDLFGGHELVRTSANGVAGLQEAVYNPADLAFPVGDEKNLVAATISTLYLNPQDGEQYLIPAVLIDYSHLLNLDALSEFKRASDSSAASGETTAQAAKRAFTHATRLFLLFAAGLMSTQALRKSDLMSKSAHEAFTALVGKGSTQKYFNAGTVSSLFLGRSTKEMSGDASTFTASVSGLLFFFSALLFTRQDLLDKINKSKFMQSYIRGACKKAQPRLMRAALELKAARWLSSALEEAVDAMDEPENWLGSEDVADSPIMTNMGAALIDELRTRILAYANKSFQVERSAEWKVLEQTTPALVAAGDAAMTNLS